MENLSNSATLYWWKVSRDPLMFFQGGNWRVNTGFQISYFKNAHSAKLTNKEDEELQPGTWGAGKDGGNLKQYVCFWIIFDLEVKQEKKKNHSKNRFGKAGI